MPRPARPNLTLGPLSVAVLLAGMAGMGGCTSFTRERYETIWRGEPQRAVQAKLGKPHQVRRDAWIYINRRPFYTAAILFDRGLVWGKLWSFEKAIGDKEIRAYRETYAPAKPKPKPRARPKPP